MMLSTKVGSHWLLAAALLAGPAVAASHGQNSSLRGSFGLAASVLKGDHLATNISMHRSLQDYPAYFVPLSCNDVPCKQGSKTWTQLNPTDGVIPCGMCVTMDYDSTDVLELPNGLDIRGTLIINNGIRLSIKTPFVLVQGHLNMLAVGRVTDDPPIKFLFTGTSDVEFVPQDENRFACSPTGASSPTKCNVGMKPFVVAGGQVRIRGIKGDSVAWTKLEDVVRGGLELPTITAKLNYLPPPGTDGNCDGWILMNENFDSSDNPYHWTGGFGAKYNVTESKTFAVWDRKAFDQGPTWDMLWIRGCLASNQKYLFSARVRLTKMNAADGTRTTCSISNSNCLRLYSVVQTPTGEIGRRKGWWEQDHDVRYGQWTDIHATFDYTADELSELNIFQILKLDGPEAGVNIEVDDVRFSLPDPKTLPSPSTVCSGNLVINGDAMANPIHPYPVSVTGGLLSVEDENGNPYFHQTGRKTNQQSIVYEFPSPDCIVENGRYKVSASIRIGSDTPVASRLELWSQFTDNRVVQQVLVDCPASDRSGWTKCSAEVTVQPELLRGNIGTMRIQFETFGGATRDMDVDDMEMRLLKGSVTSIVVPERGILDSWGKGAEILITSHTLSYLDGQVRTLVADPVPHGKGFVRLDLNETIVPPTTAQDSPDFAVEVALLSRNIRFEGDTDHPDSLIGAHFMVMQTQLVDQMIDGIEFRNYGQQGILGRYPIHFHLSGESAGAVVKRNSIRGSHQRCIVIHGTNGVLILENVAYDTKGHCFMLEDGGEVENIFRRNLGALTMAAVRPVSPLETDHLLPSTFWSPNPQNSWIENVAAGSKDNGFWFELGTSVRGISASMPGSQGMVPRTMPLRAFRDNVSHSNGKHGIRTYPHGYLPTAEATFLNNRSYRNVGDGYFIHNSKNLFISGGILADNNIQADFDMADDITVRGTSFVGVSDSFKAMSAAQAGTATHHEVIGIEIHSFSLFNEGGADIGSVSFSGFADAGMDHVALIEIDGDSLRTPHFDYFSSVRDVSVSGNSDPCKFDFSKSLAAGLEDAYIVDQDSSMKPNGSGAGGVSTVVINTDLMKTFLDETKCQEFSPCGYLYCTDTCIRTVVYAVDPAMTENYRLRVTNDEGKFVDIVGYYYEDPRNSARVNWLRSHRLFSVSLPAGSYTAFFHLGNGVRGGWPSHVEVSLKDTVCTDGIAVDDVRLEIPEALDSQCQELIRNGNVEDSSTYPSYWLQHEGGLQVVPRGGRDGSKGVADVSQATVTGALGQFLDTRCLERGRQYEVQADVKLTRGGAAVSCDKVTNCPKGRIRVETPVDAEGSSFAEVTFDVASSFLRPYNENDWNTLHGVFTVEGQMAAAGASVSLLFERGLTGATMTLDNVSLRMLPKDCSEMVFNGDFADGSSRFWETNGANNAVRLNMKRIDGKWALEMSGRSNQSHSPLQQIQNGCMAAGKRYIATARVRLSNPDGSLASCDASYITGSKACPRMRLRSFVDWRLDGQSTYTPDGGSIAVVDHGLTSDGWYSMSGLFSASEGDERADKIELFWDQVSSSKIFTVRDVSVVPVAQQCGQLVLNGSGNSEMASFWRTWVVGGGAKIVPLNDGGRRVFKVFDRPVDGDGIYQFVDPSCITALSTWQFGAAMKLISRLTGKGVSCLPGDASARLGCPAIRVMGWDGNAKVFDEIHRMGNRVAWNSDGYNQYFAEFTVSEALASLDRVAIAVRHFNVEWDLLIDSITLTPKGD